MSKNKNDRIKNSIVEGTEEPKVEGTNVEGTEEPKVEGTNVEGTEEPKVEGTNVEGTEEPKVEGTNVEGTEEPKVEGTENLEEIMDEEDKLPDANEEEKTFVPKNSEESITGKYIVVHTFRDLEDKTENHPKGYIYIANKDRYPRAGLNVSDDRLNELLSTNNKIGKKLIKADK